MKILINANLGDTVVQALRSLGLDVIKAFDVFGRGYPDDRILSYAYLNGYIIITRDRDYGTLIYRDGLPHGGVIYLRTESESEAAAILVKYFSEGGDPQGQFVSL